MYMYLDGRLPAEMRDQKIERDILTVHELVDLVSDRLRHHLTVDVRVVLKHIIYTGILLYSPLRSTQKIIIEIRWNLLNIHV